jgi:hypothetical protein
MKLMIFVSTIGSLVTFVWFTRMGELDHATHALLFAVLFQVYSLKERS